MADHGTIVIVNPSDPLPVTDYRIGGTTPTTGPPTTGQVWPRGNQ